MILFFAPKICGGHCIRPQIRTTVHRRCGTVHYKRACAPQGLRMKKTNGGRKAGNPWAGLWPRTGLGVWTQCIQCGIHYDRVLGQKKWSRKSSVFFFGDPIFSKIESRLNNGLTAECSQRPSKPATIKIPVVSTHRKDQAWTSNTLQEGIFLRTILEIHTLKADKNLVVSLKTHREAKQIRILKIAKIIVKTEKILTNPGKTRSTSLKQGEKFGR